MAKIKSLKNFVISETFTKKLKFFNVILGSRVSSKAFTIFGIWLMVDTQHRVVKSGGDLWTYVKGNVYKTSPIYAHPLFPFYIRFYSVKIPYEDLEDSNIHNRISTIFLDKNGDGFVRQVRFSLFPGIRGRGKVRSVKVIPSTGSTIYIRQSVANKAYVTHRRTNESDFRIYNKKVSLAYWLSLPLRWRNIVLLYEKESMKYEESAAALYEGLIDRGYRNVYFVLDRHSEHSDSIRSRYQKHVLTKHTLKHYIYFFIAHTFIGTEMPAHAIDLRIANKHAVRKIGRKDLRYIFLQHGVMYMVSLASDARVDARKGMGGAPPFTRIVTSSVAEAEHFIHDGNYDEKDLYITGLPKFDRTFRNEDAKRIVIMPTWRPWEYNTVRTAPAKTGYYKMLTDILSAIPEDLHDFVHILPHPLFLRELQESDLASYIKEFYSYDEVLRDTDMLITDYSSVSCDAFYRGANVIFWWKDKDFCMKQYGGHLMIDEQNIFGDIVYATDQLRPLVLKRYHQPQPALYKERFANIVNFSDGQNTDRVIQCLINDGLIPARPTKKQSRVMTYGTFDLLHYGHIRLLQKAKAKNNFLIVGLSSDDFNAVKGKKSYYSFSVRKFMLEALGVVDLVVPEKSWEQKVSDIKKYNIDTIVMGDDWKGDERFESLKDHVKVVFYSRTPEVSTSQIKEELSQEAPGTAQPKIAV